MKRLTQITDYCTVFCRMEDRKECAYWTGCVELKCGDARIYDRLAAYEDTRLEPEEVNRCKLTLMGKSLAEITEFDGVSIERLKELVRAEKAGHLVVLPCKVGDWVYALWDVPTAAKYVIYCAEVKEIRIANRNCRLTTTYLLEPIEYRGRRKEYRDDDIGKTVFLTSEEAERALEGGRSI